MLIKRHTPSQYKRYLLSINGRIELNKNDLYELQQYQLGYEGELQFYERLLELDICFIWDFQCKQNGWFQNDFLILSRDKIIHIDVKNFTGIYHYEKGNLIKKGTSVYVDCFSQLNRAHMKLEHILNYLGKQYQVESKLLFINDTFRLNGFMQHEHVYYAHQLDELVSYLARLPKYQRTDIKFAKQLIQHHENDHPKEIIQYYPFEKMSGGIRCPKCNKIGMTAVTNSRYVRCDCGATISKKEAFMNMFNEALQIKNAPLKCSELVDFTGLPERTVQRYLTQYANRIGNISEHIMMG